MSPNFGANWMDISLAYTATTKTTTGILRLYTKVQGSALDDVLPRLRDSLELCGHPLLLPTLACDSWYEIMARQYNTVHTQIRQHVQVKTGKMPKYFIADNRYKDFHKIDQDALHQQYEEVHSTIVEQHAWLTNGLSDFVLDFSRMLTDADSHMNSSSMSEVAKTELTSIINRLSSRTRVELNHRERLFSQLEIQIQVVSLDVSLKLGY